MSKPLILEHDDELYYRVGEQVTIRRVITGGFVSSGTKSLYCSVPLNKDATGLTVKIVSGRLFVRTVDGTYAKNDDDILNATAAIENLGRTLCVVLNYSENNNVKNNSPIGVDIQDLVLQFS